MILNKMLGKLQIGKINQIIKVYSRI
jgi:hypothetical protein